MKLGKNWKLFEDNRKIWVFLCGRVFMRPSMNWLKQFKKFENSEKFEKNLKPSKIFKNRIILKSLKFLKKSENFENIWNFWTNLKFLNKSEIWKNLKSLKKSEKFEKKISKFQQNIMKILFEKPRTKFQKPYQFECTYPSHKEMRIFPELGFSISSDFVRFSELHRDCTTCRSVDANTSASKAAHGAHQTNSRIYELITEFIRFNSFNWHVEWIKIWKHCTFLLDVNMCIDDDNNFSIVRRYFYLFFFAFCTWTHWHKLIYTF